MIQFGPAGMGNIKESFKTFENYKKLGFRACEIPFTYGVYIKEDKHKKEIAEIKEASKKLGIRLSIHAPYWINLNSKERQKIEESKKRILDCCKIADLLDAEYVVFHPGYYGKEDKEKTYKIIKREIEEMLAEIKKNKWKVKLAPETTGKINVFGTIEETLRLHKETGCYFTVDFSHLKARVQGKISYKEIYENFKQFDELHCHFSGIEWGEKGEKQHKLTPEKELEELISALPKNKDIVIINESPDPVGDSLKAVKILG